MIVAVVYSIDILTIKGSRVVVYSIDILTIYIGCDILRVLSKLSYYV